MGNGYAGLVQVYINHTWGYVCDRDRKWTEFDAGVTCRQMGFDAVESHQTSPSFDSTHRAWLHSVMCFGGEKTLIQCQHGDLSLRSCNQSRLAAVLCYRYVPTTGVIPRIGFFSRGKIFMDAKNFDHFHGKNHGSCHKEIAACSCPDFHE